jgi:hypothetical protein
VEPFNGQQLEVPGGKFGSFSRWTRFFVVSGNGSLHDFLFKMKIDLG